VARVIGKGYSYEDVLIVPKYNRILSRSQVNFKTKVSRNYFIDIPLLAANMDTICEYEMAIALGKLGGLGVIHQFLTIEEQVLQVRKVKKEGLVCAVAIGLKNKENIVSELVKEGVNILFLDVSHAHSKHVGEVLRYVKENYPKVDVVVGNIATKDAARYFLSKGADGVKVGVGPGSMCTTRIVSGAGVPQISAIMDVYEETQGRIPIIGDGGIRFPGDITKAIGAGASCVMLGFAFAGKIETPGKIIEKDGQRFKMYRGSASNGAAIKKAKIQNECDKEIYVEGVQTVTPLQGNVGEVVREYLKGLASGMTYMDAKNMDEIIGKADFIQITSAGRKESHAHGLYKDERDFSSLND